MLKRYIWQGREWQFEESKAPKDAVELKPAAEKTRTPANKARKAATK